MTFVQIIEFETGNFEAIQEVDDQWRRGTEGKRTARREILTRDRNNPERYMVIVFFDSAESAAHNSSLPETQAAAVRYQELTKRAPVFHDLDVLDDQG